MSGLPALLPLTRRTVAGALGAALGLHALVIAGAGLFRVDLGPAERSRPGRTIHILTVPARWQQTLGAHGAAQLVSDDNPFSESQFKTLKYSPGFPERFGSPEHAHGVIRPLFRWYNHEHRHGALCHLTPAVVHYGRADLALAEHHRVQLAAYHQHPERFVGGPPKTQRLPPAVWINPPKPATLQDAPGSTQTSSDGPRVIPPISTYGLLTRSEAHAPLGEREQAAL